MVKQMFAAFIAVFLVTTALAETPEEKGYRIAKDASDQGKGYVDSVSRMKMILINKKGQETIREMKSKDIEETDSVGAKGLTVFLTPKDQKGTALLNHAHDEKDDDQWLYLPALKRVKKIASKNKSGPFLGSEFSFEDLGGASGLDKKTYKWIRDEALDGRDCYVLEAYPKDKNSGYTKQVSWIDKEDYRAYKVEYFDRKHSHLKTMTITEYEKHLDKFWRPGNMYMENHQTHKKTRILMSETKFGVGLTDKEFTKNSLSRAR